MNSTGGRMDATPESKFYAFGNALRALAPEAPPSCLTASRLGLRVDNPRE